MKKKTVRALHFRRRAISYLRDKESFPTAHLLKNSHLMPMIEAAFKLPTPCATTKQERIGKLYELLPPAKIKKKKKKKKDTTKYDDFYKTAEWRRARYDAYEKNNGRCECCGARPEGDVYLCCDHIVPIKVVWSKRLELDNLQILCNVCNHGKGNRYTTDWRLK